MNGFLLLVALAFPAMSRSQRTCHSVSPQATDAWCNSNCNYSPPNCPPALCQCDGPSPSPPGPSPPGPSPKGAAFVGGYLNIAEKEGLDRLKALAINAGTIPITRLWLAFASPNMLYKPGSKTLASAGFGIPTTAADAGYSDLADAVAKLEVAGVEVFVSMGGWNYNCFPYFYARYSVGGYGTHTPNFWKIQQYGGGNIDNCKPENQYCWVCEPQSEKTSLDLSFAVFPEPSNSSGWKAAQKFVEASAGSPMPEWHPQFLGGQMVADQKTGTKVKVPGSGAFAQQRRDPYQDLVHLAKDLGASGVDVDYEEFWHADYFKTGSTPGPFELHQTVYKYAAILKDVQDSIVANAPQLKMSTAAGAVGAWSGKWWGGNLKGIWLDVYKKYPKLMSFMSEGANAGGVNVMTYDLSSNEEFHECPKPGVCSLDQQVPFYMNTYKSAGIAANVGYEIGTPAYPGHVHDPSHQLPLSKDELSKLISGTQSGYGGGFFWEMYKPANGQASPTDVAQAICNQVLPGSKRCKGTIPQLQDATIV